MVSVGMGICPLPRRGWFGGCGLDHVRLADGEVAAVRAWHRTLDQEQVVRGVDPHDAKVADGHASVAVLTRLADALAGMRGVGRWAARTGVTVHTLNTVRGSQTLEAVPFDDTAEATALAGANDVDVLDLVEHLDREGLPFG